MTAVADGVQALRTMAACKPDVILLDLMMPNMDGFAFAAELQSREDWRTIPVVVVTAKDLTLEDQRRLNGRVTEIVQKGGNSEEGLVKQIHDLTSKLLPGRPPNGLVVSSGVAITKQAVRVRKPRSRARKERTSARGRHDTQPRTTVLHLGRRANVTTDFVLVTRSNQAS